MNEFCERILLAHIAVYIQYTTTTRSQHFPQNKVLLLRMARLFNSEAPIVRANVRYYRNASSPRYFFKTAQWLLHSTIKELNMSDEYVRADQYIACVIVVWAYRVAGKLA